MSLTDEQRVRIADAADDWMDGSTWAHLDDKRDAATATFDAAILAPFADLIRAAQQAVYALRHGDGADRAFAAVNIESQLAGLGVAHEPDGLKAMRQAAEGGR